MVSFMSLYSFNTSFTEKGWLWLIFGSIKALEIKISIVFNLVFAENAISSCFFIFFLIIDLYFLITPVIVQTFNPVAELAIPTGTPTSK